METTDLSAERTRINLFWLVKLRWAAFVGQLATVAFVYGVLQPSAPAAPLVVVVLFAGLSNLPLQWWAEHVQQPEVWPSYARTAERLIRTVVAADIIILTLLLGLSGGADNPFAIFYFANLTLGAVFFPRRSAWVMTGLAVLCYALLFRWSIDVPELDPKRGTGSLRLPG